MSATVHDSRERYYLLSGKTSDIVRQLSFAGLALVWIFKTDNVGTPHVPKDLSWPTVILVIGLAVDLLHYVAGTAIWGIYSWIKLDWQKTPPDSPLDAPWWINVPALLFFWAKIILVGCAYVLLIIWLAKHVL
jgi:hypothetical protein